MNPRALLILCITAAGCGSRKQTPSESAIGGDDTLVYLVQSVAPSGALTIARSAFWNGAEHLDTVRLAVAHRGLVSIDSAQLRVRAGPVVAIDSTVPELPAPDKIDSLGLWIVIPSNLFSITEESIPGVGGTILRFDEASIDRWVTKNYRDRPYVTRVKIEVWSGGRHFTQELQIQTPT